MDELNTNSQAELAELLGLSVNYISLLANGKRNISDKFLRKVNFVKEDKLDKFVINEPKPEYQIGVENIPLVNQYAYAGFLSGYSDENYINDLPTYPVIKDRERKGTYRVFEVKGDSMDDNTDQAIKEHDKILCRVVQQHHWLNKLHINKHFFVIVHKTDGIVVKQIINHNTDKGVITLHSLNDFYDDYDVNLNDVLMILNVIEIVSRKI